MVGQTTQNEFFSSPSRFYLWEFYWNHSCSNGFVSSDEWNEDVKFCMILFWALSPRLCRTVSVVGPRCSLMHYIRSFAYNASDLIKTVATSSGKGRITGLVRAAILSWLNASIGNLGWSAISSISIELTSSRIKKSHGMTIAKSSLQTKRERYYDMIILLCRLLSRFEFGMQVAMKAHNLLNVEVRDRSPREPFAPSPAWSWTPIFIYGWYVIHAGHVLYVMDSLTCSNPWP